MSTDRTTIRVSDAANLLSIVPYLLGFQPRRSLVIATLRGQSILSTARMDLPTQPEHRTPFRAAIDDLAITMASHGATSAILVGYDAPAPIAIAVEIATVALTAAGIPVSEALRVTDGRFYSLTCDDPTCCPPDGTPFNPTATVAAAAATYAGMVALPDRNSLAAQLAPIAGPARDAFAAATSVAADMLVELIEATAPEPGGDPDTSPNTPLGRALLHAGTITVLEAMVCYRSEQVLDDERAAFLTVLLALPSVRDFAATRTTGEAWQIQMWSDLVRRAEPDFVPHVANMLALSALLAGNGVLASLAVARAHNADPDNRLAHLLDEVIAAGLSPHEVAAILTS